MNLLDFFSSKKNQPHHNEAPSHWIKCKSCEALMYYKEIEKQNYVCPKCSNHIRIGVDERISIIADDGTFVEFDADLKPYLLGIKERFVISDLRMMLLMKSSYSKRIYLLLKEVTNHPHQKPHNTEVL